MIVGEASVVVRAIGDKLKGDIQKSLDGASRDFGRAGEKGGAAYSKGFNKGFKNNLDDSLEPIKESADRVGTDVGRTTGERIVEGVRTVVDRDGAKVSASGSGIGNRLGNSIASGFERSRFNRTVVGAAVKLSILIPIVGAIVAGLSSLVSGLFAVIAALGTASASSVALLGSVSAMGQAAAFAVIGFQGVGEALKLAFDPEKAQEFQKALKGLPKEAQAFVLQIQGMKKGFDQIKTTVQRNMFPGVVDGLNEIRNLYPQVLRGAEQTGTAVGLAFKSFGETLNTTTFKDNLSDVFTSNAVVITTFGRSLGNLTRVIVALIDAAGPLTNTFANWFEGWTENLATITEAGNATGKLTDYFTEAGSAIKLVGSIFSNIFEGLYEIGKIAQPTGISLLETFNKSAEGLANFTDNLENVKKTKDYFRDVETNVVAISGLVKDLSAAFIRLGADEGVKKTADALKKIVPDLESALGTSIDNIGPKIAELVGEIAKLFTTLEESNAVAYAITVFSSIAKAINAILSVPGIGDLAKMIIGIAAAFKALSLAVKLGGFAVSGVPGMFSSMSTGVTKADRAMRAARVPMRSYLSDIAAMSSLYRKEASGSSRYARGLAGVKGGFSEVGYQAKNAVGGVKRWAGANRGAIAGVAALGGVAASTGGNIKFANTMALGVSGAAIAGPWGAAAGAIGGFALDIWNSSKQIKAAKEEAAKNAKAIVSGGTTVQRESQASKQLKELEKAKANANKIREGLKAIENNASGDADNYASVFRGRLKSAEKEVRDLEKTYNATLESLRSENGLDLKIQYESTRGELEKYLSYVKQQAKDTDVEVPLTIKGEEGEVGRSLVTGIQNMVDAANVLGGSALGTVNEQVVRMTRGLGLSGAAAAVLGQSLSGVVEKVDGIPDEQIVNLSANDAAILRSLGITKKQLEEIKKGAQARLSARDAASAKIKLAQEKAGAFAKNPAIKQLDARDKATAKALAAKASIDSVKGKEVDVTVRRKGEGPGFFESLANSIKKLTDKSITVTTTTKRVATAGDPGGNQPKGSATGGWIHGPGTSTSDSILSRLSNGEFVVRAVAAKKNRALLEAINAGRGINSYLPKAKLGGGSSKGSRSSQGIGGSRLVSGELKLDSSGRAFISGVANDVYNGNSDYDDAIGRM